MAKTAAGWHPEDIKAAIRKKYGTQETFAEVCGVTRSIIARAIARPVSAKIERAIADAIETPLHTLWPDRWLPDGRRIGLSERAGNSTPDQVTHHQISQAA